MSDQEQVIQERLRQAGDLPRHIAIIMDGNGRWARRRNLPRIAGHREGVKSVRDVVEACDQLGIEVLTLYTFSIENWQRPKEEVTALMKLMVRTVRRELNDLLKNNVKLMTIGRLEDLPKPTRDSMKDAIEKTKHCTGLILNLALSYSGRREILDAVKKVAQKVRTGELNTNQINEEVFSQYLYTANLPDPDLLIRTSGELRVSNFLLWQMAYTEIYVTDVLWPDFRRGDLYKAIEAYQKRERRFGLLSEQVKHVKSVGQSES